MFISGIGAAPPLRVTDTATASIPPVQAVRTVPAPLGPAVRVDLSGRAGADDSAGERERRPEPPEEALPAEAAMEPRIRIDRDTKAVVYQEVDPSSGDVVVQLPDPIVLKARAYAEAAETRARPATRPLDRTA